MMKLFPKYLSFFSVVLAILATFVITDSLFQKPREITVHATTQTQYVANETATPLAIAPAPTKSPSPKPSPREIPIEPTALPTPHLKKQVYQIAALGDSMVETTGGNLDYIYKELKRKYPSTSFNMYNYAVSAENVIAASTRFNELFDHAGRNYPKISDVKPDIIIIGSWAYNPPGDTEIGNYSSKLTEIINKSKAITNKVYLLTEIAPLEKGFGEGPGGVNWPESITTPHVAKIVNLLETAKNLSKTLGVGLIDANSPSRNPNSAYGKSQYVNTHDNIHPSVEGHSLTAKIVVDTIKLD